MTDTLQILAVDAITSVSADPDANVARIHFRQKGVEAALEFRLEDAEKVARSLSATILRMARERGVITARDLQAYELHANLEGVSLVLADSLTTESLHLSRAQAVGLRDELDMVLDQEAAQPIQ